MQVTKIWQKKIWNLRKKDIKGMTNNADEIKNEKKRKNDKE